MKTWVIFKQGDNANKYVIVENTLSAQLKKWFANVQFNGELSTETQEYLMGKILDMANKVSEVEKFKHFLRKENVLELFEKYLERRKIESILEFLRVKKDPSEFVTDAFVRAFTEEGPYFWNDIADKWQKQIENEHYGTCRS